MLYRYRNVAVVDDFGKPLYWSNQVGWVTEGYTMFGDTEVKYLRPPIDGLLEPVTTLILFEIESGVVPVEFLDDSIDSNRLDDIRDTIDDLRCDMDWMPDTDEQTVTEALKRQDINNYRILPVLGVVHVF